MAKPFTPLPRHLHRSAYGGSLRRRSLGRGQRTISTRFCMHVVLRSTQARGAWSFATPKNRKLVSLILEKHAARTNTELVGTGNAGNHLHLQLKFSSRAQYIKFICAITGEIALKIRKIPNSLIQLKKRFWDERPFTSIVARHKYLENLRKYLTINERQGEGHSRRMARLLATSWEELEACWRNQRRLTVNTS